MYKYHTEEGTTAEREQLILEHLAQVRLIARRIHDRLPENVSLDDLISTGVVGLIAAVDNFDPAHGVQLKTYAEHKIRGAILDSLRELDWAPKNKRRRAKQIEAVIAMLEQRLGHAPAEEEIAAELKISDETAQGHVKNILAKLSVHDRTEAVAVAIRRGIVHLD